MQMNTPSPLRRFQKNLNSGLIALVVLAILDRSPQDLYGLEIAALIDEAGEGPPLFHPGSIYPVLRSLARQKWLSSRIVASYSGPARRYYEITAAGRAGLREWLTMWKDAQQFVAMFTNEV